MNTREFSPEEYLDWLKKGNIQQRAAAIAFEYGDVQGGHHQRWVLDQMLRILAGSGYGQFTRLFRYSRLEEWDEGIAP